MSECAREGCGHKRKRHQWVMDRRDICSEKGCDCSRFLRPHPLTTPRVAESLDDLAGKVRALADEWHELTEEWFDDDRRSYGRATQLHIWMEQKLRALADPPAPPAADWLVPAEAMEALREAMEYKGIWSVSPKDHSVFAAMRDAVHAVLDAATEVGP